MFADDKEADDRISKILRHLTESETTKHHGRHISPDEATEVFGNKVRRLEEDQKLQDLVLTVHHSTMITLQSTSCYKIVENDKGKAYMQVAAMNVV